MRKPEEIQKEIDELRKELNLLVENQDKDRIPDEKMLAVSQKMDALLNEYHSATFSGSDNLH